jgi:hypothetical protein
MKPSRFSSDSKPDDDWYRASDVDPLLAAKDAEIERLENTIKGWIYTCDLRKERILALQAELRQQEDECERFHKPA